MEQKRQLTVAIAGLGSRGYNTYAQCAEIFPEKMKITAAADVIPSRVELAKKQFRLKEEQCFASAEELLEQGKIADVLFLCTQDQQHVRQAVKALEAGYDILMEKPISPSPEECRLLLEKQRETGRRIIVCHVLRYTPFYGTLKEVLDSGAIGDIVTVQHIENVVYWHQAHSFVRGNWRREDVTSPMILQKCCHDMDLMLWLTGKHCKAVSSFGGLHLFREELAPEGAARRCLDGCRVKESCPYDAEKIYITNKKTGVAHGKTGWPCDVLTDIPTEESIRKAIHSGPYGRCVYYCDNDVVDHQVVNAEMKDGSTISLTMTAFTDRGGRDSRFMGTKGEVTANMEENIITVTPFGEKSEVIDVRKLAEDFSGHAGGDNRMVEEFLDIVSGAEPSAWITSLEVSMESHNMAFAAEESRKAGGKMIVLQ